MKRVVVILALSLIASYAVATAPTREANADIQYTDTRIPVEAAQLSTERLRIYLYENQVEYVLSTNENYTPVFSYSLTDDATQTHAITGDAEYGTNWVDFAFTTNDLARYSSPNKPFFGELYLTNATDRIRFSTFSLTVKKSPWGGSGTALALKTPINWNSVDVTGLLPSVSIAASPIDGYLLSTDGVTNKWVVLGTVATNGLASLAYVNAADAILTAGVAANLASNNADQVAILANDIDIASLFTSNGVQQVAILANEVDITSLFTSNGVQQVSILANLASNNADRVSILTNIDGIAANLASNNADRVSILTNIDGIAANLASNNADQVAILANDVEIASLFTSNGVQEVAIAANLASNNADRVLILANTQGILDGSNNVTVAFAAADLVVSQNVYNAAAAYADGVGAAAGGTNGINAVLDNGSSFVGSKIILGETNGYMVISASGGGTFAIFGPSASVFYPGSSQMWLGTNLNAFIQFWGDNPDTLFADINKSGTWNFKGNTLSNAWLGAGVGLTNDLEIGQYNLTFHSTNVISWMEYEGGIGGTNAIYFIHSDGTNRILRVN